MFISKLTQFKFVLLVCVLIFSTVGSDVVYGWQFGEPELSNEGEAQVETSDETPDENIDSYKLDDSHSSIVFAVSHFGLSYTYGRFNKLSGEFGLESGELASAGFTFAIEADSIDTNNEERDTHLRGPDFFDTAKFPELKFVTTKLTKKDDGTYDVVGDFTMLGKTKSLTMPMRVVGIGRGPFGKQRAGYFTKFTIKRSDFGMDKMAGQIGDNISVTFSFEGIKDQTR